MPEKNKDKKVVAPKLNTYNMQMCSAAFSKVPKDIKENRNQYIVNNTDRTVPGDTALNDLFSKHFPDGSILISDIDDVATRHSISKNAWKRMLYELFDWFRIPRHPKAPRHMRPLFRLEDTPENKEYNRKLNQAIDLRDFQSQAALYDEYLRNLPTVDPREMLKLTDKNLSDVGNYSKVYKLFAAAQDASLLLDSTKTDAINRYLSKESRERMRKLANNFPAICTLLARYEMICHPYYEKVDFTKLTETEDVSKKASATMGSLQKNSMSSIYFSQLQNLVGHMADLQLSSQLQKNGLDLATLTIVDANQKQYALNSNTARRCKDAFEKGTSLIFRDGNGTTIAFRPEKGELFSTNPNILVDNAIHDCLTTRLDKLVELTTSSVADPIWMLTGSAEYRAMKSAQAEYAALRKKIGTPPKEEYLGELNAVLEHLEGTALNYLKHKDPDITDDMSFEDYMTRKGNALNMNKREKARLEAAFHSRDLARDTRGSVSLGREMGLKNKQIMAVDRVFYQGLLRKYEGMEAQFVEVLSGPDAEKLNGYLNDPIMSNSERNPYPDDNVATLLWEMREMTDMIERTEIAMGLRHQDRKIDADEKARIEKTSKFGETDPATLSVDVLWGRLSDSFENAAKEQAEKEQAAKAKANEPEKAKKDGPHRLDYSAKEFVPDPMVMESEVGLSNSSAEIQSFLNKKQDTLSSASKSSLNHRFKSMQRIEYLQKNNPSHPPKHTYEATRNGVKVEGQPTLDDKIMLPGVHERRSQNTMNGCWSVTLCSQFEYRGIELAQEEIRAYRPTREESSVQYPETDKFYKNLKQTFGDYSGLASKVLPNSPLMQGVLFVGRKTAADRERSLHTFKNTVFRVLTEMNSPVSLNSGGHYLTIVGMEGDKFFVKNPMHIFGGDPETIETWTFDDFMKKADQFIELNWFADVTPSLGGSIEPTSWCTDGIFYGNGRPYTNSADMSEAIGPKQVALDGTVIWNFNDSTHEDSGIAVRTSLPVHMYYNRIPGCNYNADALKAMENELGQFYKNGNLPVQHEVMCVLETAQALQAGIYKDDPDAGMLTLANHYVQALKAVKAYNANQDPEKKSSDMLKLQETLAGHLQKVRTAVIDTLSVKYKLLSGTSENPLANGNFETRPADMAKDTYARNRKNYLNMREGLAGMLYLNSVKSLDLEDGKWINMLTPKVIATKVARKQQEEPFNNMLDSLFERINKADYFLDQHYETYKQYLTDKGNGKTIANANELEEKIRRFGIKLTKEEAIQKLEIMEKDYEAFLADENLIGAKGKSWRSIARVRIANAAEVRNNVRSGDGSVLEKLYLVHLNKYNEKVKALNEADRIGVMERAKERAREKENAKAMENQKSDAISAPNA